MRKKILKKVFALAALLLAAFFANAQQGERLPVMASPEERLLNRQNEKQAKSERPTLKTPWLLSRTQTSSPQGLAPTNVLVNNNNGAVATGNFTQSETTILAYGNNVITGFNDAGSNAGGANRFTGYAYSTDGGLTFTDAGNLPVNAGGDAGDPVLARNNTTGRIYFSTLGYSVSTIQLFRSDDNGLTWLPPVNATPGGSSEDKQWMTVDNYPGAGNGNLYLMSRRFAGTQGIYFHRSIDNGSTFSAGIQLFTAGQGAFVEVDPAHNIYAFYINSLGQILMRKSTDQGLTFAAAVTVAGGLGTSNGDLALTGLRQGTASYASLRSNSFPHVAINPESGHIYVTFNNNPAGVDKADIYMVMSTDAGATWSLPVRVNDDATTTDQWQPTIAVSPDGLNLGIFYYSRQEDPISNNLFKYYCRTAAISGAAVTFRPSGPVSDVAAIPEFGRDAVVNSTYMGDYQQAAATATGFYVTWADSRSDLAIGPPRKDPNVYFAKVPLEGVAGVSILVNTTAPVISGGNGNALIDVNECNSISIGLTNLGSVTAQNISSVITSSTPGVVITQGNSVYPDIAPGASAANTTAFTIVTSTGYICGTNVQLTLTVTSADGVVVFNFILPAASSFGAPVSFSNNTVTPIPDVVTTDIPITVSGITSAIGKVTLSLHLLHTFDADLDISLIGPDGTTIDLSSDNGGASPNYGTSCDPLTNRTTFDDAGVTSITTGAAPFVGTFIPEQSLAAFNGKSGAQVNGTWILRIVDDLGGDFGTFNCATLNIAAVLPCTNDGPPITCPANITTSINPVNYTVSTASNGPVTVSYVFTGATTGSGSGTGSGSTFGLGTTTVAVTSSNGCLTSSCSFTVEITCALPVINTPTVTQPTCATPTGTIVVNATGTGALEYSVDNGATYQASVTFSGLAPGNYNIKVRLQASPSCEVAYTGNPVELTAATGCCITNPVVTNNANSGPGSLRQAVIDACPGSTITFANSVISPISLSSGLIRIDKNITILGPGTALTVQNTAAKSFASRVFHVVLGASANISGLTISGANTWGSGGGIYNEGVLNLANVTVSNNLSDSSGAGIYNLGTLTVTNSTISNNLANSLGYTGIGAEGGGIYTASFFGGSLTVINTTISNNYGNLGGGIYGPNSTINSRNSIIAGNTVRFSSGPDFLGTVTSQGYNLVGKTNNSSGWVATDLTGTIATPLNPQLGPLADNGGPTQTLALLTGSPAINAGSNALAADPANIPLVFDQRGTGYPRIVGSRVDIGAFEVQCIPPTITAPTIIQPTCLVPTGTIVVNATGNSPMEYSVDNGATWQPSATFSGLVPSNYYIISVRQSGNSSCASTYAANPVVIHAPVLPVVGMSASGPLTFCAGGSVNLGAEVSFPNYLRMTAPYVIDFSIGTATFGANISTTPLNGDMVYIPDATASYLGCNPYTAGSLTGKVALIDRGACFFVYKAKNAQDAGAIAVIIVNNISGDPVNMGNGDPSVIVSIPVISVTQQDGALLKNMIAQGTTNGNTLPHTYSYLWSNGATTQSINVTQSGTFTVQVTDENGCSATTPPETVTVNPVPDAVATPASQSVCTGSTIATIVNSSAVSGTVFNWTRDNTADVTGIAASGTGDITGTLFNTTNAAITVTFTITPSYTNEEVTCTGTAVTATVLVAPKPVLRETYNGVQVTANNDGTDDVGSFAVCSSTSDNVFLTEITDITNITPLSSVKVEQVIIKTNVTINTAADGIYVLSSVGPIPLGKTATLINPLISGSVQIKRRAFYDANNNNSIDANECVGDWVVYNITVNPIPVAVATPAAQSVCSGSAITSIVNSSGVAGTTFSWTRDNIATVTGIAANGTGNISGTLTNTTAAPVTVTFTVTPAANGCTGEPITATVIVNPALYFACPGNMTETITDLNIPCFKAVNTPNPVFCGTLTKLTWKLTGATVLNSPTSGINYLGLRNMNVGTTTVTYTATFTGGTVKTCSFTVLVIETVPPNIYCPLDKHVNTDPGKCYKTGPVSLGTPTTSDNCGVVSVTNNAPAVYNIGVNYVTWTVTDKSGNTRSCVQRVTVSDAELPTITCPANVIANTGPVCASTPVTVPVPVFNDNCGVEKLTWAMTGVTSGGSPLTGINFVPTMNYATGVSTITYTVTDASGNVKMCSFTVTVKDVTPPTLVCPPAQTFCKVPNNTYTVPVLIQSDNCVILSTTYKITGATSRTGTGTNASGLFNQGISTITWTVKDVNGNTSTCTTTVTVVATTSPLCTPLPVTGPVANPKPAEAEVSGLSITAWPNPSSSYFNLKVNSKAKETLEIRMIDMAGKLIQVQRGAPGDTYQLGSSAVSGVYIIEVQQAGKTLRTKVVKQ